MSGISIRPERIFYIALLIMNGFLSAFPALAGGCEDNAVDTTAITFSETWRGHLTGDDEQWLRLAYLAEVSVVVLEVTRPLSAVDGGAEPLLTVRSCAVAKNAGFTVLERSPTRQALFVHSPGDVVLRVTSQDPLRGAGPVKVTASRAPGILFVKETEEIEIEPEIIPSSTVTDDYADATTYATPLEAPAEVSGEIANAWGDDADVFSIDLAESRTLTLATHGSSDTIGGLLDASGQLLAVDDDGGSGGNFRLVRALLPGRYFVRVEGSEGTRGSYTLTLEAEAW